MSEAILFSGYSVEVWFGRDLAPNMPDAWRWWMDTHGLDKAVTEQQRMEYYYGTPARVVRRLHWRQKIRVPESGTRSSRKAKP